MRRSPSAAISRPTRAGATSPSTRCRSSPDGLVHDPVGGLDDLAAGRVRFIGDAGRPHPRGLPADSALLSLFRAVRRGRGRRGRPERCDPQPARDRRPVARAGPRGNAQARRRASCGRGCPDDGRERDSGADGRLRLDRALRTAPSRSKSARGAEPDALLRLAALAAVIRRRRRAPARQAPPRQRRIRPHRASDRGPDGAARDRGAAARRISCASSCFRRGGRRRATRSFSPRPIPAQVRTIRLSPAATVSSPRRRRRELPVSGGDLIAARRRRGPARRRSSPGLSPAVDRGWLSQRLDTVDRLVRAAIEAPPAPIDPTG